MGQQYSAVGENAVAPSVAERKTRGENVETGNAHPNPVWRKSVSAVVTSLPSHGELISGDSSSSHRSKADGDASRMSIRAAIDSFIENCLSAPTEETAADQSNADSSFSGKDKEMCESLSPKTSNSSTEDTDKAQSACLLLEDKAKDSSKGSEDETNNSLKDLKGETKGSLKDFKDEGKSPKKDMEEEVNKTIHEEVSFNCVEQAPSKDSGKDIVDKLKAEPSEDVSGKPCAGAGKEVKECGDQKLSNIKKDSIKDNSAESSHSSSEKQTLQRTEKLSFSAFLQDRLNRGDFDKHEELAQLALSKDIKCQEQMIMWEAVKKPTALSESSGTSYELDGSLLTTGPVRLQTLIDRVLDSSLNNRNSAVTIGNISGSQLTSVVPQVTSVVPQVEKAGTQLNLSRSSPLDQGYRTPSSEKIISAISAPHDKRLSFKNHIEKVLIESFLSYEEDEKKETLKKESIVNGQSIKANSDSQTRVKECTISVQDLVDQVISQTEMSKLLTPSTRDTNRPASSLVQADKAKSSFASDRESSLKPKAHSLSPQNTALIEAQRHLVQKELQSSTSLGRKRGRPQLNASSSNSVTELARDPNLTPYNERVQEGKSSRPPTRMSSLNYASKGSLPYGVSLNMSPLSSHSVVAASATTVLQNRHYVGQNPNDPPSSISTSLPSVSIDYHLRTREPFHHQLESHHVSSQAYQSTSHSHNGGFMSKAAAPPPLILANQVSRVLPVPHAPSKSCSCPVCLHHFSQSQNHTSVPQHHIRHQLATQDKPGNPSIHPSNFIAYQPHLKNFKDIYSHQASVVSEAVLPVLAAPVQSLPSVVMTTQQNRHHSLPSSRETASVQRVDSHPLPAHHHPNPIQDSVTLLDTKFPDAHYHVSKPRIQPDIHGSDLRRLTGSRNPHPGRVEDLKVEAAAVCIQRGPDFEQPLDLSVKLPATGKPEKNTCVTRADVARQNTWDQGRMSPYRQPVFDRHPSSKTQCVVSEQRLPDGHHLQRLENSVDKILPHGQPQLYDPRSIPQTHLPLPGVKMGSLSAAPETRLVGREEGLHELALSEPRPLRPEPLVSRASSHFSHSPIIYNKVRIDSLPPQQQQQQRQPLASPQNSRKLPPSPNQWSYQITSPDVNESQLDPTYPVVQQRPHSLGSEPKQKASLCSPAALASGLTPPQKSPSPEDGDGQNLVSKHEPIQNIIGNHLPTDILYLICRLCRQTYGSPYGFRKHFRNQHGFEPKADHTIVQTISATKTAMAHTEPLHSLDETPVYPSYKQEQLIDNSQYSKSQSEVTVNTLSCLTNNSNLPEDSKLNVKKEMDTKCLECPECGQTFQLNDFGSYKRHCRQHSLNRSYGPFACHDCHKSFGEPQQLREHLLTHSSETPSLCGVCHTFFSSSDHLTDHLHVVHGHTQGNDGRVRSSPHSDGPESNRSENVQENQFSACQSNTVSASLGSASPSSTKLGSLQPGAQELRHPSSSAGNQLPTSQHYHWNKPPRADTHMFTVHTPKDLEVEKLPADGIVTTASPDSSYDDAKFQLDSQPASSTVQGSSRFTEAPATSGSDEVNSDTQEMSSNSSQPGDKESISNSSDNDSKESTICFSPKKEESSDSLNSKSLTVKASNSSLDLDDSNSFYRHKKYGRHWKRHSASDGDGEPSTKSPKVEGASLVHRQSPYSVSSTNNYTVSVEDCQSSSPNLEQSSLRQDRPNNKKEKSDLESQKAEDHFSHKLENKQKSDKTEKSPLRKEVGKITGTSVMEDATKFKWDRQTRSQAGKTSNTVTP